MIKLNEKNSIKNKIYLILIQKRLVITDIKKELKKHYEIDISESDIRVYLKRLFDKNKIKKLERDGRYVVYTAISKESNDTFKNSLRKLYNFMSNEDKCELKEINESDIVFLTRIKEMIQ